MQIYIIYVYTCVACISACVPTHKYISFAIEDKTMDKI